MGVPPRLATILCIRASSIEDLLRPPDREELLRLEPADTESSDEAVDASSSEFVPETIASPADSLICWHFFRSCTDGCVGRLGHSSGRWVVNAAVLHVIRPRLLVCLNALLRRNCEYELSPFIEFARRRDFGEPSASDSSERSRSFPFSLATTFRERFMFGELLHSGSFHEEVTSRWREAPEFERTNGFSPDFMLTDLERSLAHGCAGDAGVESE